MSRPSKREIQQAMAYYSGAPMPPPPQESRRTVRRSSCSPADVPPWRFLRPGIPLDQAVSTAAKALRIKDPASLLVLAWKLRAAGEVAP